LVTDVKLQMSRGASGTFSRVSRWMAVARANEASSDPNEKRLRAASVSGRTGDGPMSSANPVSASSLANWLVLLTRASSIRSSYPFTVRVAAIWQARARAISVPHPARVTIRGSLV
jgi:hypothetical protein